MPPPDATPRDRPGFADLFAALPVAAIVVSPDSVIAHANAAAEEMLNLSERAMIGRPLASVLSPPDSDAAGDPGNRAVYDAEITTSKGRSIQVDLSERALPDHPGWRIVTLHGVPGARTIGRSDHSAGERAAAGAAAMLAHEIKNPLSGIRGAAQLLGPHELTTLIVTEVDRVAALIDRMEAFADHRPLQCVAENIYPLIGHARTLAEAGFAQGLRIEERFDPSLPPATVNRDALLQILINLLKNAREAVATVAEPRLTIATAYRHGITRAAAPGQPRVALPIEIAVIDNGPGAPDDIAQHLFDPFVSGRPEGRGLGLALVGKLVRDMGGIVQYAREGEPRATVFRLLLPRG
ncbi:two-component system sensor histidine kinase NtrB [Sphingomonas rubra]|uniref:histidine kinase n=1 Tax=Sphingomonas rubra TaxID=634430 RepID=A0A1I5PY93_9SPHN|nr:ATP-binding protein [Sphingomonas rubra]SFP39083.1 two-component system, NtrC family, nitrogen regulation sensor histidine kinase GlnL [Sphingomonas rubra]